ncbi:hypothetical protein BH10ACT4_BH10ACT4_05190 [soil metagenome]
MTAGAPWGHSRPHGPPHLHSITRRSGTHIQAAGNGVDWSRPVGRRPPGRDHTSAAGLVCLGARIRRESRGMARRRTAHLPERRCTLWPLHTVRQRTPRSGHPHVISSARSLRPATPARPRLPHCDSLARTTLRRCVRRVATQLPHRHVPVRTAGIRRRCGRQRIAIGTGQPRGLGAGRRRNAPQASPATCGCRRSIRIHHRVPHPLQMSQIGIACANPSGIGARAARGLPARRDTCRRSRWPGAPFRSCGVRARSGPRRPTRRTRLQSSALQLPPGDVQLARGRGCDSRGGGARRSWPSRLGRKPARIPRRSDSLRGRRVMARRSRAVGSWFAVRGRSGDGSPFEGGRFMASVRNAGLAVTGVTGAPHVQQLSRGVLHLRQG